MKFQNPILKFFGRMDGQAQSNMPLQIFQSWGHNDGKKIFTIVR